MKKLSDNWLTEGIVDFEYKKYILLAYLQHVRKQFSATKLYPHLAELVKHYRMLTEFKNQQEAIDQKQPKMMERIDWKSFTINYRYKAPRRSKAVDELLKIVQYAMPRVQRELEEGKGQYEEVEAGLTLEVVGVSPLYKGEGYLLLGTEYSLNWEVYRYQVSIFSQEEEDFRSIKMTFIEQVRKRVGKTLEQVKLDLVKRYKELPNPATFGVVSAQSYPIRETLLPISKRLLMRSLGNVA